MKNGRTPTRQRIKNLSLAAIAGQSGCATVVIVFVALIIGFWLDARLNQQGLCTFGMLIASVPFSLYAMLRIALGAIDRISPPAVTTDEQPDITSEEEV